VLQRRPVSLGEVPHPAVSILFFTASPMGATELECSECAPLALAGVSNALSSDIVTGCVRLELRRLRKVSWSIRHLERCLHPPARILLKSK
jgi:hypothetical protein